MNRFPAIFFIVGVVVFTLSCAESGIAPDPDLAGHWTFDEVSRDGMSTPDASGNNRPGSLHGQTPVEGVIGRALLFEGYDHIVEVGDLGLSSPVTIAFWVKTNDLFHDRRLISQLKGPESQAGALRFDGTRIEVWDGEAWQVLIDRDVRINEWIHVTVVYSEGGKTVGYLNGVRQHLVACGFDFEGVEAGIGAPFLGKIGNEFIGRMDDFRVYRRALSEDEVRRLYEGG